jgi:tetratricopeptide (TPR) repeat protein
LRQRSALPDEVLAEALARLAHAAWSEGDLDAATAFACESIDRFRRLGDSAMAAWASRTYLLTLSARGAYADALELAEESLGNFRDLDNQQLIADTLNIIGVMLLQVGDFDRAREALRQAIAAAESIGDYTGDILHSLGDLELEQRNLDDAEALYARARDTASPKDPYDIAATLAGLACVAALRGETEGAGAYWGHFERIEETTDRLHREARQRYERILEPLMTEAAFRRGYDAGRAAEASIARSPGAVPGIE